MFRRDDDISEVSERTAVRGVSTGRMIPRGYIIDGDTRWFELFDLTRQECVHVFDGIIFSGATNA